MLEDMLTEMNGQELPELDEDALMVDLAYIGDNYSHYNLKAG